MYISIHLALTPHIVGHQQSENENVKSTVFNLTEKTKAKQKLQFLQGNIGENLCTLDLATSVEVWNQKLSL